MPKIKLLGDVHLGRPFRGAPLDRRGDREALQWAEFEAHLNDVDGVDLHIQVGDLFDSFAVSYGVVYRAAMAYRRAAAAHPNTTYALHRGNHDASRDLEKVSAFMIFTAIVGDTVTVAADAPEMFVVDGERHILMPWHPVHTAGEMVLLHEDVVRGADVYYGHHDVVAVGDHEHPNLIPHELLTKLGVKRAVTGHDHSARELVFGDLPVTVTGSMQPLSHGEDADERFYVTRSLEYVLEHPDDFHDKHLRVRLGAGQTLDAAVDCLSLSFQREGQEEIEHDAIDLEFEPFDFDKLLLRAAGETGLPDSLVQLVRGRMQEARVGDA